MENMKEIDFQNLEVHLKAIIGTMLPTTEEVFRIHRLVANVLASYLDSTFDKDLSEEMKRCEEVEQLNRIWNLKDRG